jgi:hypothetical protein
MIFFKKIPVFLFIAVTTSMTGCTTIPSDAFKVTESSLQTRQMQTRSFETKDEAALLSAGASVLQDMGYLIEEVDKDSGLITAEKDADATDTAQVIGAVLLAGLTGQVAHIDSEQKIRVSLVTTPSKKNENTYLARITFQKIVWNTNNKVTQAITISDPEIYQAFFQKLSQSVFLEAHTI